MGRAARGRDPAGPEAACRRARPAPIHTRLEFRNESNHVRVASRRGSVTRTGRSNFSEQEEARKPTGVEAVNLSRMESRLGIEFIHSVPLWPPERITHQRTELNRTMDTSCCRRDTRSTQGYLVFGV